VNLIAELKKILSEGNVSLWAVTGDVSLWAVTGDVSLCAVTGDDLS